MPQPDLVGHLLDLLQTLNFNTNFVKIAEKKPQGACK